MNNLESLIDYFKDMVAYYTARINYYNEQKNIRSDKGLKHSEVDKLHRLKSIANCGAYKDALQKADELRKSVYGKGEK